MNWEAMMLRALMADCLRREDFPGYWTLRRAWVRCLACQPGRAPGR